jgi:hypothetical protein
MENRIIFPDLENWEKSEEIREFKPENLFDYINGAADSYLSYQFKHLWVKEYTSISGATIKAEVYEHKDQKNAFGIYSIERSPDYPFQKIGAQAYRIDDILNMIIGKYYVKLHGYGMVESEYFVLETLARRISDNLDSQGRLPDILEKFPEDNEIQYSEMYIAENFLGYDFLHNAFGKVYEKGDQKYQLFVLVGEDREDCHDMLTEYLKYTKESPESLEEGYRVIHDRYNGDIYLLWRNNLILGTVECTDESVCKKSLKEFVSNLVN